MSENNNQKKGREKDRFAKPGDESIVSGKSFFLSFGNTKKSSANPLIESEKSKNNQKTANEQQTAKQGNQSAGVKGYRQDGNESKQGGENGGKDKKGRSQGNYHGDRNKNRNQNRERPQVIADTEQKAVSAKEVTAHEEGREKDNRGNRNNRDNRNRNRNQNRNQNHRQEKAKDIKEPEKQPQTEEKKLEKNKHGNHNHKKNPVPEQNNAISDTASQSAEKTSGQRKNGVNPGFDDKKRQKHKKEKFVPSVPEEEIKAEELLQPIVDRAGISSSPQRSFGIRSSGFGSYMQQSKTPMADDKNEPRYIERNRPLAEQIIEQSKPKTYKNHITENTETVEVIGVRFREAGKIYYFAPGGNKVEKGQPVIVETARGVEYGFCAIANRNVSVDNIVSPLKPILRTATADDTERYDSNKQLEAGAAKIFREKVKALGLEMSLVYVEYTFDNGKLLFYFTADGRVDFRELIKELAASFRTRIELRQIGVRDEAKIVGGLGICGRPVCCKSFLGEFSQVSIKMAKDQNLFINSSKISGTCGRFMCCIRYEDDVYQKEYERTPKVDAIVDTPEGKGVVVESNALKGVVKVLLDDKTDELPKPYKCTEIKLLGYIKRENENEIPEGVEIPADVSES